MLNQIVNLAFLLLVIYYGLRRVKIGVLIYCIGTFVVPIFRIGGLELSFDVWCFPIVLAIYSIKNKKIVFRNHFISLVPYAYVYIILSLINAIRFDCGISVATIYATIRFILTIKIIDDVWEGEVFSFVDKAVGIVILANAICSIVQMANIIPVKVFYDLYYKDTMTPLLTQLEIGSFNRAYGTTGSPVILGGIAAFTYAFYFSVFVSGKHKVKMNVLKMGACIICGVFALSKTAILAIPIISVYIFFISVATGEIFKNKRFSKTLLLIAIGAVGVLFVFYWMRAKGFAIDWYLKYLKNPFAALDTRYNSESGILSETMDVISEHILLGVGHANFNGVFIGDSSYIVLLYHTGIIGLFAYLFPYCIMLLRSIKRKDVVGSSLIVVFFLIAIGNSMYLSYWFIPFAAFMFESNKKVNVVVIQNFQAKKKLPS